MFDKRSEQPELMDDFTLNDKDFEKNIAELVILNKWFGSQKTLLTALKKVQQRFANLFQQRTLTLVDLGCGTGDLLYAMSRWFSQKNLPINLMGIDANPLMIRKANQIYSQTNIEYKNMNFLSVDFTKLQFDIVTLNSVCHHFDNSLLIQLLTQLKKQTRVAIIINDLHRHPISYFFIKYFARWFMLSTTTQHDGPLSILRAFKRKEIIYILQMANITSFKLHWNWPFRWQLIIWLDSQY